MKSNSYLYRFVVEVHSSGCAISNAQGPSYTAIHRIEIIEKTNTSVLQISFRIDYKKTVFQESKVDKRVHDKIKKFYQEEIHQLEKGIIKLKAKKKESKDVDHDAKLLSLFASSLNIDSIMMAALFITVLFNIYLYLRVILSLLK